MNRRTLLKAAAVAPGVALLPVPVVAAPLPYGDEVLCQLLKELNESWQRHTWPTAFGPANLPTQFGPASMPTQFGLATIPPRPFRAYNPVTRITS